MKALILTALPAAALLAAARATAQVNDPAPGYSSLMGADYATAEREIRAANAQYDPASTINLGIALAKTGHPDQAADQFRRALVLDDVQIVVADGQMVMSHDVARRALAALQNGVLSR
jgi:Tfp pilus assembly protein PilF